MSVHELTIADMWLQTTLSDETLAGFAPGGFHVDEAPDGTPTPYGIYALQSGGNDSLTMNVRRLLTNPLYQVMVTGEASKMSDIVSAASYVDDLLKRANGTVTGGYIAICFREMPLEKGETINDVKWKSVGGLYRLQIQQTT